jgi:DNA-binding NtrC family response regulator
MAELLFFRDGEMQMRSPLRQERVRLGRSSDADFVLPDKTVSRQQCEIFRKGNGWSLVDVSGRGTKVSNRTASDRGTTLKDGDEIRLGTFSVVFSAMDSVPLAPESTAHLKVDGATQEFATTRAGRVVRHAQIRYRRPEGEVVLPLRAEDGFTVVIGSQPEGKETLRVDDEYVSAEHCRIVYRSGVWALVDRKSRNGTFVENLRVIECLLGMRTQIRVGETTLYFDQLDENGVRGAEALPNLVTSDPAMEPVVELVRRLAPSLVPVAIHGETGVGKEVVARALHDLSARNDKPFVAINCGAIARETAESELFGHERGAFTGAEKARIGAFEEADGGTLFLDEVGELPLAIQVKLLRALERGEIRRLGGSRTQTVNVRIITATHRDLLAAVEDGSFREDLYYRLCVAPIEVPPLRQRVQDVMTLAAHFAASLSPAETEIGFESAAKAKLEAHPWYGNARELRNTIQLALLTRRGSVIAAEDLTFQPSPRRVRGSETMRSAGRTLEEIEREAYRQALDRHSWDKRAAMEELGVPRSTFFRKIDEFGLTRLKTG